MQISTKQHLTELHSTLLHLHKMLLDMERRAYERNHGRVTAGELLKLAIEHRQFAWLRAVSELLVRIEELMENVEQLDENEAQFLLKRVEGLLVPAEEGTGFARSYFLALQSDPGVVLAHRAVWNVLTAAAVEWQRKSGGLH